MNTSNKCPWLDDSLELLEKLPRGTTLQHVAISARIPLSWLSKFKDGKFKTPNIYHVYNLLKFLTDNK